MSCLLPKAGRLSAPASSLEPELDSAFRHEAMLYAGEHEFVAGTMRFIEGALSADEPILVVVGAAKIERLRSALGTDADAVCFADMADVGANPARIIPAWQDFVDGHAASGRRLRGIGEPIDTARSADELVECQKHEELLNLAFSDAPAWWLLCPYDVEALPRAVIDEAERSHPYVMQGEVQRASSAYPGLAGVSAPFDGDLPEPVVAPATLGFDAGPLQYVRQFVAFHASGARLDAARTADLVLAVSELVANSLRHGGGSGDVRIWPDSGALLCEVRDRGCVRHPLAGRERPDRSQEGGRGLWLANQLCDLVQIRSSAAGTVVRLHMRLQ